MYTSLTTKEINELQNKIKNNDAPNCKCGRKSIHMNWGPNVGSGYFCEICRDDVEHPDNIYGLIAQTKRKISLVFDNGIYVSINCTKVGCKTCLGVRHSVTVVDVPVGSWVKCTNNKGLNGILKEQEQYEVVSRELGALRIKVNNEKLSYSRCRFVLKIKNDQLQVS